MVEMKIYAVRRKPLADSIFQVLVHLLLDIIQPLVCILGVLQR